MEILRGPTRPHEPKRPLAGRGILKEGPGKGKNGPLQVASQPPGAAVHALEFPTMRVLALESSCDESAVAVLDDRAGLLAHELFSQVELHRAYGGVVPELASRDHVRRLAAAGAHARSSAPATTPTTAGRRRLHGRSRAWSARCSPGPRSRAASPSPGACRRSACTTWRGICWRRCSSRMPPPFPHVALLVSGGHTMLIEVSRGRRLPRARADARRCRRGSLRQDAPSSWACPIRAARSWRELAEHGAAGAFHFPAPDARSRRARVQLLGTEDRGDARGARRRVRRRSSAPTSRTRCRRPSSRRSPPRRCGRSSTPA